jgi:hypothetical protein
VLATGPSGGMAAVTIDGISMGSVDLYTSSSQWQVLELYTGLASGSHKIVVTALGTKNVLSKGTQVVVDAFVVNS